MSTGKGRGIVRTGRRTGVAAVMVLVALRVPCFSTLYSPSSVKEANSLNLSAGDTVIFTGGTTYSGTALDIRNVRGTTTKPVVFAASGTQRAIIEVSSGEGLKLSGTSVHIRNIHFKGPWNTSMSGASSPDGASISKAHDCVLDNCEVSNFAAMGIEAKESDRLRIEHCDVHDVGWDGINVSGGDDLYIGNCTVYTATGWARSPHSGSGILLGQIKRGVIEYCEAYDNGGKFQSGSGGGPVGIWSWDSDSVVIQYCESHHNKNGNRGTDGGGFDIDGGDSRCIIQYCYSHDNEGPGYLLAHWDASGGTPTDKNLIRYCISQNDSRDTWQGCISMWSANSSSLTNTTIHNCVVYTDKKPAASRESSMGSGHVFYNNIFITANGAIFNKGVAQNFAFVNNCYWSVDGPFLYNSGRQSSIEDFRATGQEMHDGKAVGIQGDPGLAAPGQATTLSDPAHLQQMLSEYKVSAGSPVINAGIAMGTIYANNPSLTDFFGTAVPAGTQSDIGIHEYTAATTMRPAAVYSVPAGRFGKKMSFSFDIQGRILPAAGLHSAGIDCIEGRLRSAFETGPER